MGERHRRAGRAAWVGISKARRSKMARNRELKKPVAARKALTKKRHAGYMRSLTPRRRAQIARSARERWAAMTPERRAEVVENMRKAAVRRWRNR